MDFYVKTLSNGKYELYNRETDIRLGVFPTKDHIVACMALNEDYEHKIAVIERAMLCLHGVEVDGEILDIPANNQEFERWYTKISMLTLGRYYEEIDITYEKVQKILKSYAKSIRRYTGEQY